MYNDVEQGRWSYSAIKRLTDAELLAGYPDGSFRPTEPVTREEAAALIYRTVFGLEAMTREAVKAVTTVSNLDTGSLGSGPHIGDGYILTNHHVVASKNDNGDYELPRRVGVRFDTHLPGIGTYAEGEVVYALPEYDLAMVKLILQEEKTDKIPHLPLGNLNNVYRGSDVVCIGSPLGLKGTVTRGVVSYVGRSIDYYDKDTDTKAQLIQTDAHINPGNSGGAMLDIAGNLIGIPSVKLVDSGVAGLNFAISIESVSDFLTEGDLQNVEHVRNVLGNGFQRPGLASQV